MHIHNTLLDDSEGHYVKLKSQTQKEKNCMISFAWGIFKNQIHRSREYKGSYQGQGRGGMGDVGRRG